MPPIKVKGFEKFDKEYFVSCYLKDNKKIAAFNLWQDGLLILTKAKFFQQWDELKTLDPTDKSKILPFIHESIIDQTRIIICFENFMKGQLILNEFLVHQLSDRHPKLKQLQKKRPINIDEVINEKTFKNLSTKPKSKFDWTEYTLRISTLFSQKYQEILNLPPGILSFLEEINSKRNKLHFFDSHGT